MPVIDFYYDFASPNAYVVHKVLPVVAARTGAEIAHKPALLGGIFKATNNQAPFGAFGHVTGKVDYIRREFGRFVERHAVPFTWNPHFPVNSLAMMRGAIFSLGHDWADQYRDVCFDAMWQGGALMSDPEVMFEVLQKAGLPADDIASATQSPEVKGQLASETEAAVARGIFGAPTMFLGDEMFFGKDSLSDLEWRLSS